MGVRILHDSEAEMAALYCFTTGIAFGPVFHSTVGPVFHGTGDPHYIDANELAKQFLAWMIVDARSLTGPQLEAAHAVFLEKFDREGPWWEKEDKDTDE